MVMRFSEDKIRRTRLPHDVRALLHDLCWHMEKTPVLDYVKRAQEIMMKKTNTRTRKEKRKLSD